ncbi:hypothetical protein WKR88_27090 [Trinickia caryophylli]|uniref:Secreted effector protein SseD n=1 Tax=Trinickia caryophylli TaxID=28094 RepID=A0A1X7EXH1_TRICW|nr:hypothetical protein [Trinickia caryophylli]PMS09678.1 hypothetical protein C0Z17_23660 [Trinickia caryophylli]TRX18448.1 hypothetical protein FNF07_09620 [Trinickia caryophylli]WQE10767.1 hypothetical protein U0034_13310 [Trinickia caryophylli]SMF41827.1 secreted effector protein SseD [Trinickia caryophylli]GLU33142.1 hypothetical protein Busp01_29840 [Trinickia caryophylli]
MAQIQPTTTGHAAYVAPSAQSRNDVSGGDDFCDGALQSIDDLIVLVQKFNLEMRELDRKAAGAMQEADFKTTVASFEERKAAIEKKFNASVARAVGSITAGTLGMVGSVSGNEMAMGLAEGGGKLDEGLLGWAAAGEERDAEEMQMNGELKQEFAKQFGKAADDANDKARDALRQLVQAVEDLVALKGRIQEAVRL